MTCANTSVRSNPLSRLQSTTLTHCFSSARRQPRFWDQLYIVVVRIDSSEHCARALEIASHQSRTPSLPLWGDDSSVYRYSPWIMNPPLSWFATGYQDFLCLSLERLLM